ncbi:MAG: hypothetical protein KKE93_00690 [Nanoarchaeota archaeon]|nr:hypothetical protein [Nanoarchaeota archaeon]
MAEDKGKTKISNISDIFLFSGNLVELNEIDDKKYEIIPIGKSFIRTGFHRFNKNEINIHNFDHADDQLRKMVNDLGGDGAIHYLPITTSAGYVIGIGTGEIYSYYAAQGIPVREKK